ncbi:uncharacterized protein EHS24_005815 [Apiotrichum porosum]|uniref:Uncharacterized protein n=1 Tax=Apiotrichum porosum TaxID=105984 RepID=A0A427XZR6_9TREE|nr:uncharacterized protein EHS24_005815 [Apiotrichum porosum]RSH84300.1 hypothetical protein EHS24_005815 [Apiotrichum porosum]
MDDDRSVSMLDERELAVEDTKEGEELNPVKVARRLVLLAGPSLQCDSKVMDTAWILLAVLVAARGDEDE